MKNKANWIVFGLLFIVGGFIWLGNAYSFQSEKTTYLEKGVLVHGKILSGEYLKVGGSRTYTVRVKYTTQADSMLGKYISTNCKLINGIVFDKIQEGMDVDVLYLSENPEENTVLVLSLEKENISLMDNYLLGYIILGIGFLCIIVGLAIKKAN